MELMQPHLLSKEKLVFHLEQFKIPDLKDLSRDKLIQLYQQYVMPKPQRKRSKKGEEPMEVDSDKTTEPKIVRLSGSLSKVSLKRDVSSITESSPKTPSKRQKITWP